jgi:hypothetical protein
LRTLDKFEALTAAATYVRVLLANEQTGDWELIDPTEQLDAERAQTFAARSMCFGGVLGIVDGAPKVALAVVLDSKVLDRISRAFLRHVAYAVKHPKWCVQPDRHAN